MNSEPALMWHKVRTVKPDVEASDWTEEARAARKWDVVGTVVEYSDSHGLIYRVGHDDGSGAWYEPRELSTNINPSKWDKLRE